MDEVDYNQLVSFLNSENCGEPSSPESRYQLSANSQKQLAWRSLCCFDSLRRLRDGRL